MLWGADFLDWSTFALALVTFALVVVSVLQFRDARASLEIARSTMRAQQRSTLVEAAFDSSREDHFEVGSQGERPILGGEVLVGYDATTDRGLMSFEVLNVGHGPAIIQGSRLVTLNTVRAGGHPAYWDGPDERLVIPVDRPRRLVPMINGGESAILAIPLGHRAQRVVTSPFGLQEIPENGFPAPVASIKKKSRQNGTPRYDTCR
jgi:hypothetical protein